MKHYKLGDPGVIANTPDFSKPIPTRTWRDFYDWQNRQQEDAERKAQAARNAFGSAFGFNIPMDYIHQMNEQIMQQYTLRRRVDFTPPPVDTGQFTLLWSAAQTVTRTWVQGKLVNDEYGARVGEQLKALAIAYEQELNRRIVNGDPDRK